jgi:phage terminase large subunit
MALTLSEEIEYIQLSEQDELDASLLSHINAAYLPYLSDFHRYQILKGGAGAGKSVFIAQKIIYNMRYRVGYNVMVVRDVGKDNHDTTFQEMQKAIRQFGWEEYFQINNSNGKEEITCLTNENKCIFRGLIDVERVKSITFKTGDLICIWIEEASEINEHDFNQLDTRLRGKSDIPKHIILSFNPIDIDSWLKKRFFDFPLNAEDGYILETTYKNNAFLDEIYKRILESYKDTDWYHYQIYVLNQWGSISTARVFHNIVIEEFEVDWNKLQNWRQGIDFGFNHANAFEQMGFIDGELYIVGEVYAKNMINRVFIQSVKDNLGAMAIELSATADSADPDKISEFNQEGFSVHGAQKGPGSLMAGVNYLKALPKIHIHKTNCPNAAREFVRMKYRELKDGTILDEVVEIDDDTIAAVRYATEDLHASTEGGGHYFIQRTNW